MVRKGVLLSLFPVVRLSFFLLRGSHFPFSHRAQNVFLTLSNTAHFAKCACSLVSIACKILFYLGESVGQTKGSRFFTCCFHCLSWFCIQTVQPCLTGWHCHADRMEQLKNFILRNWTCNQFGWSMCMEWI